MIDSDYMSEAVKNLAPGAEFTFINDDLKTLSSLNGVQLPSIKDIQTEIARIKAQQIQDAANLKSKKAAILERLGLTEDEAKLLLS